MPVPFCLERVEPVYESAVYNRFTSAEENERGFTFALPAHRSCGRKKFRMTDSERPALYPRPERRGFTAQKW
jgi:hypothetical protein